ncbi:hypothetical protein BVX94_01325 [bacterium B17]|nr:hypothetical protein BVX94_01325 [bacterium B17]
MDDSIMLDNLSELSAEFGTNEYLKGGGGNSSVKNDTTMWIKPSGTVLCELGPDGFLPMDREKIHELYDVEPPDGVAEREELVKNMMMASVLPGETGRPSVEAPLHETIDYTYVMHTHPVLVNGMTCSKNGAEVCGRLFPDAMWFEKPDAGYMLCKNLREELAEYKNAKGSQPEAIFLKNHGLFVSSDTPERMRELHAEIMNAMRNEYQERNVTYDLIIEHAVSDSQLAEEAAVIKKLLGDDAAHVVSSEPFAVVPGPITPDHIVYSKSYPFIGQLSAEAIEEFKSKHGYSPRVIKTETGVYGVGTDAKSASLALELAVDGSQVMQLAEVFGGLDYLSSETADFFDNWEVEKYRRSLMSA